jgi:hypothetical protein
MSTAKTSKGRSQHSARAMRPNPQMQPTGGGATLRSGATLLEAK